MDGVTYEASSGEVLDERLVQKAAAIEMETFKKHRVYTKVPPEERWEVTGKRSIGVKWVDVNKGDAKHPEYRSRLVTKEIKHDRRDDLLAATPPLEAKTLLF